MLLLISLYTYGLPCYAYFQGWQETSDRNNGKSSGCGIASASESLSVLSTPRPDPDVNQAIGLPHLRSLLVTSANKVFDPPLSEHTNVERCKGSLATCTNKGKGIVESVSDPNEILIGAESCKSEHTTLGAQVACDIEGPHKGPTPSASQTLEFMAYIQNLEDKIRQEDSAYNNVSNELSLTHQQSSSRNERVAALERENNHLSHKNARLSFELYVVAADLRNLGARLSAGKEKAYASGKSDYLNSPEYVATLKEARMNGAQDSMGSKLKHLNGIKEDFDMTQLSFLKDSRCKKYKKFRLVDPGWKDDEFVELAGPSKNTSLDGLDTE
ncbi:hypothetical protein Salat_1181500 [Sesamum alatum]|uniref:Uncharacterized protein n=1 Tax=Sesamum alatum TaxID=300844 RepID=A0AAE1YEI0_9LAMI|nr:hypothetical protein Salat_1181500 [Sesamum alatum]